MPPIRKRLSRAEFLTAANPKEVLLDAVIDLIATQDYISLPSTHTQLVLFYDNEVCNGGHLQYFHNQGVNLVEDLLSALGYGTRTEFLPEAMLYAEAGAVSLLIDDPAVRPAPWRRNAPGTEPQAVQE